MVVLDSPPLRVSGGGKKGAVVIDKEEEEEEDPLQALGIDTKAIEAATRLKLQQQKYQDGGVAKMLWYSTSFVALCKHIIFSFLLLFQMDSCYSCYSCYSCSCSSCSSTASFSLVPIHIRSHSFFIFTRLNNEMINRTRSLDSDENHTTLLLGRNAVQPSIASIVRPNPLDNTNNNTTDPETQLNLTIVNPGFRPESVVLRVHQNLLFHKVIPTLISCGWSNIKDPKSAVFRFDGMNLDMNKSPSDYYLKPEDKLYLRITKSNQPLTVDQEDEQILANLSIPTSGLKGSGGGIGTGEPEKEVNPEDLIRLKLVAASGKGEKFRISKYEPLAKLFDKYCSKHNLDPKTVKFVLDGEALSGKDSPEMLELEDDDSIDVQIKATTSTTTTTRK